MTEKRGPGRPPTQGAARPEILRIRVTADERAQLQAAAEKAAQPLALWMRGKLLAAAKRQR